MSPAVTTVLGRSPDDWYADPQLLAKMIHPDDQPLVAAPRQYSAPNHGSILVIDDEEAVRVVARNMLERCGFTVYAAANGPAGLEMLPELASLHGVVLDLTMPSMGGDTVARAIQKLRPGLPIVLMSGYSAIEVARQYAGLGIASFLQKPFTLDTLEGALRDMVP
jgi:two-component system cell cycle sensor histidine kinase/response regulator CckA